MLYIHVLLLMLSSEVGTGAMVVQECTASAPTAAEQSARRDAVKTARIINSAQANQPGRLDGKYLSQIDLHAALLRQRERGGDPFLSRLNFSPDAPVFDAWTLKLDLTPTGYWFIIKNPNDPCVFAVISNEQGSIFTTQPLGVR